MQEPIKVKWVPCPRCGKELFSAVECVGRYLVKKDSAALDHDGSSPFMKCPHCSERITLKDFPSVPGSPLMFELSDNRYKSN